MLMFIIGFLCGVVATALIAALIFGRFMNGMSRSVMRGLGW